MEEEDDGLGVRMGVGQLFHGAYADWRRRGRHMFKQWCSRKCDELSLPPAEAATLYEGTARTTRTGAQSRTHWRSSAKLECSEYGTSWMRTAPARTTRPAAAPPLAPKLQPLGRKPTTAS